MREGRVWDERKSRVLLFCKIKVLGEVEVVWRFEEGWGGGEGGGGR